VHNVNLVFELQRDGSWELFATAWPRGNCFEINR
jgi:hypothetical protein